jgi:hypothetical protein
MAFDLEERVKRLERVFSSKLKEARFCQKVEIDYLFKQFLKFGTIEFPIAYLRFLPQKIMRGNKVCSFLKEKFVGSQ